MNFTLGASRGYLTCGSVLPFGADFYAYHEHTCGNSLDVQFADITESGATTWNWNFGDGSGTSTAQHPSYTYSSPGVYTVTLNAGDGVSSDIETKTNLIAVGAVSLPYSEDFESGTSDLGQFRTIDTYKNDIEVHADAANASSFGLMFDGYKDNTSGTFRTPTSANCL